MKKKKLIFAICFVAMLLIIGVVVSVLMLTNTNSKEYNQQLEIYDRYAKIAEKINVIIIDKINPIDEVMKKDIGDNKSIFDELNSKKEELLKYKIDISDKKITDFDELKEATKKLKEALQKIDETLIDLKDEEIDDFTINENHEMNKIFEEIEKLVEEANTLAKKQEEKKAREEQKQKILNGDLSLFEGSYQETEKSCLTIKNNEFVLCDNQTYKTSDMQKITLEEDGSYKFLISTGNNPISYENFFRISADYTEVTFCKDLGCNIFTKIK